MEWVLAAVAAALVLALLTAWLLGLVGGGNRARARRAGGVEAAERTSDFFADLWDWLRRGR